MGLEPEKISQIIEAHTETITGLQDDLDKAKTEAEKYKADADKLAEVQKELENAQKEPETAKNRSAEYEKLKKEYEDYKTEQAKKEQDAIKAEKFRELLKDIGLSEKGIKMALKWQGVDGVEVDENGKITNAKELKKSVKEDWGEYITSTSEEGADTSTPPDSKGGGTKMTLEQIDAIEDATERQKAMLENHELYGF
jgi:predicted RNase H-like nuclease (RuvC/YqgF family)